MAEIVDLLYVEIFIEEIEENKNLMSRLRKAYLRNFPNSGISNNDLKILGKMGHFL